MTAGRTQKTRPTAVAEGGGDACHALAAGKGVSRYILQTPYEGMRVCLPQGPFGGSSALHAAARLFKLQSTSAHVSLGRRRYGGEQRTGGRWGETCAETCAPLAYFMRAASRPRAIPHRGRWISGSELRALPLRGWVGGQSGAGRRIDAASDEPHHEAGRQSAQSLLLEQCVRTTARLGRCLNRHSPLVRPPARQPTFGPMGFLQAQQRHHSDRHTPFSYHDVESAARCSDTTATSTTCTTITHSTDLSHWRLFPDCGSDGASV